MNSIFRDDAINKALSPENLNRQIKIIKTPFSMLLATLFLAVITAIIWSFFASIPITLKLKGVIFPQEGIATVTALEEGVMGSIRVKLGNYVKEGDVISYIPQIDILDQIKISQDSDEIQQLRMEYHMKSMILSPSDGQIISLAQEGQYLKKGDEIAKLVKSDDHTDNQEVTAFAAQSEAKILKKGMLVQISPDFAPREQYGYMEGIITKITNFPSKPSEILRRFGGFVSETDLSGLENNIEIKILISADVKSKNLKKWSNPKGETLNIDVGTKCNIVAILDRVKPVDLFFSKGSLD